jgi:hypothetical protein
MPWSALTLVTDAELGQLEPEAVHADAPWGATTWANARAEGKRDLKILLESDFSDIENVADKVVDTWRPDWVYSYIASAFTDVTTAAADKTEDDLALGTIFATFGTDRLYIGCASEFEGLRVLMTATVNAIASTLTVKYSGPTGWTALTISDGTSASSKTFSKSGRITWTIPSDWQREQLNGMADAYYWLELSVSAALTAGTSATQLLPIRAHDGLKRVAALLTLSYIFKGLSAAAVEPKDWLDRAVAYRDDALALWGKLKNSAAVWLDLDRDEAIEDGAGETHVSKPLFLGRA